MRQRTMIVSLLALAASGVMAQEELKASQQAMLLLRILSFDRNLEDRPERELKVVVVYRVNDRESEAVRSEMLRALEDAAKRGVGLRAPIQIGRLPYTGSFESDLDVLRPTAVYVAPGLSSQIGSIAKVTRRQRVLSFTADASYVQNGLSIGLIVRDSKPTMLINLAASRLEGADLSADLLRLAEVIR